MSTPNLQAQAQLSERAAKIVREAVEKDQVAPMEVA
jgi:hypothetical protein